MNGIDRLQYPIRSVLSVPAADRPKIEKGLSSAADVVFLDLEDSVVPSRKSAARNEVIRAIRELDWGTRPRSYRINAVVTEWCYRDVIDVVELAGERVDRIVVPKVNSVGDIAFVDRLLRQLEHQLNRSDPIQLELQIESPAGLLAIQEIAREAARATVITFGQGDFAASAGMPASDLGVPDEWDQVVPGDRWLTARQTIVFTAVANGRRALNGAYAAYRDHDGFRNYCRMSRALGFAGTWCIHPDQIAIANDVFTPSTSEIAHAKAVIEAITIGNAAGAGAVGRCGVMADEATVRMARNILTLAANLGIN